MYGISLKSFIDIESHPRMHEKRAVAVDQRDSALEYTYFEILTAVCVDMVRADGAIETNELDFLHDLLGLSAREVRDLVESQGFVNYRRVFDFLTGRQKQELLSILLEFASTGRVDSSEAEFLTRTVDLLRLPEPLRAEALDRIQALDSSS